MINRNFLAPAVTQRASSLLILDKKTEDKADLWWKTRALRSFEMAQEVSGAREAIAFLLEMEWSEKPTHHFIVSWLIWTVSRNLMIAGSNLVVVNWDPKYSLDKV